MTIHDDTRKSLLTATPGVSHTLDMSKQVHVLTVPESTTLIFDTSALVLTPGEAVEVDIYIIQDGAGGSTVTLPSNVVGTPTIATTADLVQHLKAVSDDEGGRWLVTVEGTNA